MAFRVFLSYSHQDKGLLDKLKKHLDIVRRRGLAEFWDDSRLSAGTRFEPAIYSKLDSAHVIVLLISADFLSSEFCYSKEMDRALARERAGTARVIPVILHDCHWDRDPRLKALSALPRDGLALTLWANLDTACANVVEGIFAVLEELAAKRGGTGAPEVMGRGTSLSGHSAGPARSLSTAVERTVSAAERLRFLSDAHTQLARHFERALASLRTQRPETRTEFTRVDGRTFVCRVVQTGRRASECAICVVPDRGWITFSEVATSRGNSYSECLSVAADGRGLFLRCLGLSDGADPSRRLTPDSAAALLWNRFLEPL